MKVSKESSDRLVNAAERKADWWIFGGIYRPVYLEAKPTVNIERIAVDAKADGSLKAEVFTTPLAEGYKLNANITPVKLYGNDVPPSSQKQTASLVAGEKHQVQFGWMNVKPWNTESPNLYLLELELVDKNNKVVHQHRERIGFRTVVSDSDGLYVNDRR